MYSSFLPTRERPWSLGTNATMRGLNLAVEYRTLAVRIFSSCFEIVPNDPNDPDVRWVMVTYLRDCWTGFVGWQTFRVSRPRPTSQVGCCRRAMTDLHRFARAGSYQWLRKSMNEQMAEHSFKFQVKRMEGFEKIETPRHQDIPSGKLTLWRITVFNG